MLKDGIGDCNIEEKKTQKKDEKQKNVQRNAIEIMRKNFLAVAIKMAMVNILISTSRWARFARIALIEFIDFEVQLVRVVREMSLRKGKN